MGLPFFRYLAGARKPVLPLPMMNVLNGGEHADNNVDIQEFMLIPIGAESFSQVVRYCSETFHTLKGILKKKGWQLPLGTKVVLLPI